MYLIVSGNFENVLSLFAHKLKHYVPIMSDCLLELKLKIK